MHPNKTLTVSMLVLILGLVGCGIDAAEPEPAVSTTVEETDSTPEAVETTESDPEPESDLPGDYGQIIASEDDCDELQGIFDTADQSNMDGRTDVMAAADNRMREVGCYDD